MATPSGEQPIATLQVGQQVQAYDPTTGKVTTQTIQQVWLNHDSNRLDVTLAVQTAPATTAAQDASSARTQQRQVASHGRRGPPDATTAATTPATTATATTQEVVHTTANHPWLSADHGWLLAGTLRVGEPVRLLDGGTARVVALHALPGVGPMWDLSLDATHTFAVGNVQAVVHNCTQVVGDPSAIADKLDENTYFHYTNKEGYEGIMNDSGATFRANAKGRMYVTQEIQSPAEAEQNLFIGNPAYVGKGDYVIAFQAPEEVNFEPGEQENEFFNRGTVRVPISNILFAGPNPFR